MSLYRRVDRALMAARGLPKLVTRTVNELHNFHVAHTSAGFFCLDFNRWFDDLATFEAWAIDKLKTMPSDEICPAAPEAIWLQFLKEDQFLFEQTFLFVVDGVRRVTVAKGEFV